MPQSLAFFSPQGEFHEECHLALCWTLTPIEPQLLLNQHTNTYSLIRLPNCKRKHLFSFGIYIIIILSLCKLEIDIGMIFSYHLIDWKFHSIDGLENHIEHDCCWLAFVTSTWQTLILINLEIHIIWKRSWHCLLSLNTYIFVMLLLSTCHFNNLLYLLQF